MFTMFMMFSPTLSVHVFPPSFVITIDQMRAGFQRIYNMMGDISIDVPQVDGVHHTFSLPFFWNPSPNQIAVSGLPGA